MFLYFVLYFLKTCWFIIFLAPTVFPLNGNFGWASIVRGIYNRKGKDRLCLAASLDLQWLSPPKYPVWTRIWRRQIHCSYSSLCFRKGRLYLSRLDSAWHLYSDICANTNYTLRGLLQGRDFSNLFRGITCMQSSVEKQLWFLAMKGFWKTLNVHKSSESHPQEILQ